uniref:CD81 molecule n=1 Tax=Taeniopygia guttata TaxID=59729 RepID=A0A674H932_TAEGU
MGVEGCTKCIKYLLFVFNFIFWLAGGIILGVALWLRHDSQTTNILYLQLGDKQAPNTFYVGIYILIAVGAVMMFVGFLGCYGAIQESQCLLGTFFTCLVILFACEVAAGIWGFVNKDQIAKDVKQFYDQALQQALMGDADASNAKAVVKTFHETLDCCGSDIMTSTFTPLWRDDLCRKDSVKSFFEDPEHGAVLWHKEQLRLLSRESRAGEGGIRADGARGDPKCHRVTRRHFNNRQRKLCI